MKRFFMYTDGRTGSTAICDELGKHASICCWQELLSYGFGISAQDASSSSLSALEEKYADSVLPYEVFKLHHVGDLRGKAVLRQYIEYLESKARQRGKDAIGFKVLYHHASHWEADGALEVLRDLNFLVLHNMRLDLARKFVSGAIARMRNIWNTQEAFEFNERVLIDVPMAHKVMDRSKKTYRQRDEFIKTFGFDVLLTVYEDFLEEREAFLNRVFGFLEVPEQEVDRSTWKVVTPGDLSEIIENYEEVRRLLDDKIPTEEVEFNFSAQQKTGSDV